jgi:predicted CopG family antitoxin
MIEGRKTISITDETHELLDSIGSRKETFDDIIRKCIDAYMELQKYLEQQQQQQQQERKESKKSKKS